MALLRWFLCAGVMMAVVGVLGGAGPTTRGVDDSRQQIRQWFLGLSDADSGVREAARWKLLGLKRADLGALRAAAAESRPLEGPVAAELKQIVAHVYLSEDKYDGAPLGFLGIEMPQQQEAENGVPELVVGGRMPGFRGFAALKNGDVIMDIEEKPLAQPPSREQFIDTIQATRPGTVLHLKVLRQGKMARVAVALDARPASPDNLLDFKDYMERFNARRSAAAEGYWRENFGVVVGGK